MNSASIMRPVAAAALAIAAMWALAIPEALAQKPDAIQSSPVQAVTGSVEQITLTIGKGGLFQTSAPYAKISVSDEKIVEVTPQSDREFVVNPKGIGSTNVFVFDAKSALIARLEINVVSRIAKIIQKLREETNSGKVRIYIMIHDSRGSLVKPAQYQCNHTDCEIASDALNVAPGPTETPTASPKGGATPDNESPPVN